MTAWLIMRRDPSPFKITHMPLVAHLSIGNNKDRACPRLIWRMFTWRNPRGGLAAATAFEFCTKSIFTRPRSFSIHNMRPRHSLSISQHASTRSQSFMQCRRDAIRTHILDLARKRRRFSTQSALSHGHIDPPKPGEELYVTFVDKDGDEHKFAVSKGDNLLDIAQANDLEMEGKVDSFYAPMRR